ncbi:MAG TPA: ROK family protein [Acidimicrobiia bacterium]|nr:ROK family protein [Acidimicrobiia bacterium]
MIGIDVGGSHIKAVRLVGAEVRDRREIERSEDRWLEQTIDLIKTFNSEEPVGVGLAGLVDHRAGRLIWAPHIRSVDVDVGSALGRSLGRVVAVDNDANCAALAESRLGSGVGADTVVVIMVGTGIGMGLVVGGRLFRGRALAGEAGHMTMVPRGLRCPCGRQGCWETVISGWRLAEQWGTGRTRATASAMARAARSGDRRAHALLEEAGRWLGRGLANLIALLDPDVVVVGGGVIAGGGEEILAPARSEIGYLLEGADHREVTPVVAGAFGMWAGAVGAALMSAATSSDDLS